MGTVIKGRPMKDASCFDKSSRFYGLRYGLPRSSRVKMPTDEAAVSMMNERCHQRLTLALSTKDPLRSEFTLGDFADRDQIATRRRIGF